jgi:cytochrome oxidase assembly protein ShyY1
VRFKGHYDPSGQMLVSGRILNNTKGFWVVTPVVVNGTGSRIPVVRGFVASPSAATKPSNAPVTVTGALAPGEAPSALSTPAGQLTTVDLASLLTKWGGNVYNGFVFLTAEQPAMHTPSVQAFPPPKPANGGLSLVNAGYALQWWTFAVFAIFIYFRELRREAHPELRANTTAPDNQVGSDPAIPTDQTEGSHV